MAYYEDNQNNQVVNAGGQAPEQPVQAQGQQFQQQDATQQFQQQGATQQFQQQDTTQQFQQQAQPQQAQGQQFQQQTYQQQPYQQQSGYNNQGLNNYVDIGHSPSQIMVFGIVSLCASILVGWTVIFGILAIVFGALAMNWAKKFMMANPGVDDGQVKAGRITGIIGLIFGIIDVVGGLIAWFAIGCAAILSTAGGY